MSLAAAATEYMDAPVRIVTANNILKFITHPPLQPPSLVIASDAKQSRAAFHGPGLPRAFGHRNDGSGVAASAREDRFARGVRLVDWRPGLDLPHYCARFFSR